MFQCTKERGRIILKYITTIEQANINSVNSVDFSNTNLTPGINNSNFINNNFNTYCFQIGYSDSGQDYYLYLVTFKEKEREDWIQTLRSGEKCSLGIFLFLSLAVH